MSKIIDLTGRRFGRLTVLRRAENNRWGATMWLCRCDCGLEKIIAGNNLQRGMTRSCWCLRREASRDRKFLPRGEAARNQIFFNYQTRAAKKGLEWELTEEQFHLLMSGNCRYCGCAPSGTRKLKSGSMFVFNGIDRKDSTKGYIKRNVVTCCKICNYAKHTLSQAEFIAWINRVAFHLSINPLEESDENNSIT